MAGIGTTVESALARRLTDDPDMSEQAWLARAKHVVIGIVIAIPVMAAAFTAVIAAWVALWAGVFVGGTGGAALFAARHGH